MKKSIAFITLLMAAMILLLSCSNDTNPTNPDNSENNNTGDNVDNNGGNYPHTHAFGEWNVISAAGCEVDGLKERTCECGKKESEAIVAIGHGYVDGSCANCGSPDPDYAPQHSEGLVYTSNGNGTCYISGIGSCTDTFIVIPEASPVGETVLKIASSAFENCTFIEEIYIPKTIKEIEFHAFTGCNIKAVYIDDLSAWCKINFLMVSAANPLYRGADLYLNDQKVTQLVIPEDITNILDGTFNGCTSITSVVIPKTVTSISGSAFLDCDALQSVYYGGTESEWYNINGGINSSQELTRYYYSSAEPASIGNFWHYIDGIPTIWPAYIVPADHQHSWSDWEPLNYPMYYCEEDVNYLRYCPACGATDTKTEYAPGHNWGEFTPVQNTSGTPNCQWEPIYRAYCTNSRCYNFTTMTYPAPGHSYSDGACIYCGKIEPIQEPSGELSYELSTDGTYYIVTGIGSFNGGDLVILNEYNGLPVKEIAKRSFINQTHLTSITIPENIITIGYSAFENCIDVEKIYFNATAMNDLMRETSVFAKVGDNNKNVTMYVGKNVTRIPANLFEVISAQSSYHPKIVSVVFEEDSVCESIGDNAFAYCYSLKRLTIPISVKSLGKIFGYTFTEFHAIFYMGNEMDWNNISLPIEQFRFIKIYYYSEDAPTSIGSFWHYVDGVPAVWEGSDEHIHKWNKKYDITLHTPNTNDVIANFYCDGCDEAKQVDLPSLNNTDKYIIEYYDCHPFDRYNYTLYTDELMFFGDSCVSITFDEKNEHYPEKLPQKEYCYISESIDSIMYSCRCSQCDKHYVAYTEAKQPAHIHNWGDWTYAGFDGYYNIFMRTCQTCGDSESTKLARPKS